MPKKVVDFKNFSHRDGNPTYYDYQSLHDVRRTACNYATACGVDLINIVEYSKESGNTEVIVYYWEEVPDEYGGT